MRSKMGEADSLGNFHLEKNKDIIRRQLKTLVFP